MSENKLLDKLRDVHAKFMRLEEQMTDPSVIEDMKRFMAINKEYKDMKNIVDAYLAYEAIVGNIKTANEMLKDSDLEMQEMAKEELQEYKKAKEEMEEKIKFLLIPKDPDDDKDVIFEIRSGTGGDEASIFVGDLYRMYGKFFENKGWKVEVLELNEGDQGGYSKISLEILGEDVYGQLKFESGAHRVQRVPKTESQGRVHTSAATVAVIPKYDVDDIKINKADLRVDTFRSSGAGGQHVNKTESGVRFTHLPTGVVSESTEARSQIKNREIALQKLYQRIQEMERVRLENEQAAQRRSLVGSGDRSDKIRTYNYPQNRLTDHRINLTLYSLEKVMEGDIQEIIEALTMHENMEKLKESTDF
jgi:peptide chain release factor 1